MSSYIVDDKTIDKIVFAYGVLIDEFDSPLELGQEFLKLNNRAVNIRYKERSRVPKYTHTPTLCSMLEAYKATSCLIYQCSQENCMETKTGKKLQKLLQRISDEIITSMDEYKKLPWI